MPSPLADRRRLVLLLAGLMVGLLLSELDQSVFATALPTVVGELDGVDRMLWVTTAYVLAGTIAMPVYGKLGDVLGRRPVFVAALTIFVLGSLVGGLAPDMTTLIAGRALQGVGGGGLLILVQAIIADVVPARQRAAYLSVVGAVFALAAVAGPVLGGWLTETVGWRWAFWINLPLGAAALVAAVTLLPAGRRRAARVVVDWWGIVTMALAVTSLVLVTAWGGSTYAWSSPVIAALVGTGVVAGTAFGLVERRATDPLIGLHLFRDRNFTVATGATLVLAVAVFGAIGYLPTYLQMVSGLGPTSAGMVMLSLVAGLALSTLGSAQIVSRTGHYKWLPVVGCVVVAVALAALSTLTPTTDLRLTGGYLFVLGVGMGATLEILVIVVQISVPSVQVGSATAAYGFFREIGVSVGSALVGALFTGRLTTLVAERLPSGSPGRVLDRLTPEALSVLPSSIRTTVATAYADALTPIFLLLVPVMLVSALALSLVRATPLPTTVPTETDPQRRDRGDRDPALVSAARP